MEEGGEFGGGGGVPGEPWGLADSCVKLRGEGREVEVGGGRGKEAGESAENNDACNCGFAFRVSLRIKKNYH